MGYDTKGPAGRAGRMLQEDDVMAHGDVADGRRAGRCGTAAVPPVVAGGALPRPGPRAPRAPSTGA
ncbi:hypothetical protein [Streptomyces sp. NPDC048650]|uniref:hypothetical protein n=1 Tax=unclassified Streptomyces TaxID=2593676 RepID=UPI003720A38E